MLPTVRSIRALTACRELLSRDTLTLTSPTVRLIRSLTAVREALSRDTLTLIFPVTRSICCLICVRPLRSSFGVIVASNFCRANFSASALAAFKPLLKAVLSRVRRASMAPALKAISTHPLCFKPFEREPSHLYPFRTDHQCPHSQGMSQTHQRK